MAHGPAQPHRTLTRSIGLVLASAGCAATLALSTSTTAAAANTALMVNGIGAGQLTEIAMANILGGMFGKNYVRENVPWPQQSRPVTGLDSLTLTESIAQGVVNLDAELTEALAQLGPGESVTLVGLSAGALVVDDMMRELANDPNAPDKSKIKFVVVADSSRIGFNKNRYDGIIGYQYRTPVDSKFDTIAVAAEYDGFADFPDRWWNFLAVANALAGTVVQHVPTMLTNLSTVPESNITVTTNSLGGVTTSYLIPAKRLPLVILLPFLAPQEADLRKTIDSAYARNDNKGTAAAVAATTLDADAPSLTDVPSLADVPSVADVPSLADEPSVADEPNFEAPAETSVDADKSARTARAEVSQVEAVEVEAPEVEAPENEAGDADGPTSKVSRGATESDRTSVPRRSASQRPAAATSDSEQSSE